MYIVQDRRGLFISAPSGYAAKNDGTIYRDGTNPRTSAPELGKIPYQFDNLRYAQQQRAKTAGATIREL